MPNSRHNWLKFRCCSLARITNRTRCSRSSTMFHAILPAPGGPRSLLPPWLRSGQSVKDVVITTCKACHESEHLKARTTRASGYTNPGTAVADRRLEQTRPTRLVDSGQEFKSVPFRNRTTKESVGLQFSRLF